MPLRPYAPMHLIPSLLFLAGRQQIFCYLSLYPLGKLLFLLFRFCCIHSILLSFISLCFQSSFFVFSSLILASNSSFGTANRSRANASNCWNAFDFAGKGCSFSLIAASPDPGRKSPPSSPCLSKSSIA